jgi:hypothetical protein
MRKFVPFAVIACVAFCVALASRFAKPLVARFAMKQPTPEPTAIA